MEARHSSSEISIGCLNSIEESLRKQVNCVDQFELGIQSKPLSLLAKDGSTISNRRKMLRNGRNPENILKGLIA